MILIEYFDYTLWNNLDEALTDSNFPPDTAVLVFTEDTVVDQNTDLAGYGFPDLILRFQADGKLVNSGGNFTITGTNNVIDAEEMHIFSDGLTVDGSWLNRSVYASWFGADGSGSQEQIEIQRAIDFADLINAEDVYLSAGTHNITDTIELKNHIRFHGYGTDSTILKYTGGPVSGSTKYAIEAKGAFVVDTSPMELAQPANPDQLELTLNGSYGFDINEILLLRTTAHYPGYSKEMAEMVQLREDSTTTVLDLRAKILNHYASGSASWVERIDFMENILIEDLTIDMDGQGDVGGIEFSVVANSNIQNCKVTNASDTGIAVQNCIQCTVEGNEIIDSTKSDSGKGISLLNTCSYITVNNNTIRTAFNCVNLSCDSILNFGVPVFCNITGNYSEGDEGDTGGAGIVMDTSPEVAHINFLNNILRNGYSAFAAQGQSLLIANNQISGTIGPAIGCHPSASQVKVANNIISRCQWGIDLSTENAYSITDNNIDQTDFHNPAIRIVAADPITGYTPTGNKVIHGNTINTSHLGIQSTGLLFQNVLISDNMIHFVDQAQTGDHIALDIPRNPSDPLNDLPENNLIISNNQFLHFPTAIRIGEGARGWQIIGNNFYVDTSTTSTGYGIHTLDDTSGIGVKSNQFQVPFPITTQVGGDGVSQWTITGNKFTDFSGSSAAAIHGYFVNSLIDDNYANNGSSYFIHWETGLSSAVQGNNRITRNTVKTDYTTGNMVKVFYSDGYLENNVYVENTFLGFNAADVLAPSATQYAKDRIQRNIGYVTENRGLTSVGPMTTSTTVAHGLDHQPQPEDFVLTPTTNILNGLSFYISNVTQTTFDINLSQIPGGSVEMAWQANL